MKRPDRNEARSAAAPSPFTPIADYAFLSNCHTGALDRARRRDRLALRAALRLAERVRQPARPAGRLLPLRAVRDQPSGRARVRARHERARNDVEDPGRLDRRTRCADDGTLGPRRPGDAPHPSAGRRRRRPHARPYPRVHRRSRRGGAGVRARLRLRPDARDLGAGRRRPSGRRRHLRRADDPASAVRHEARDRGDARARAPHARSRRHRVLRALLGRGPRRAGGLRRCHPPHPAHGPLLAYVAEPRPDPRPPVARPDPTVGPDHQGPDVHADGCDRRRAHDVAAGDAGRRTQLGLPLHLDARHDVHAAGTALPRARLGSRRVHAVHRRYRGDGRRLVADHVRDRRPPRPHRVDA